MPKRQLTNLAICLAILPLLGWWLTGLTDLDEGFYAAVVAEMNRRGEWITPYYNGNPWFEKPILLYWLAKPCLAWFGEMVGPRLPSVLCAIGTYFLIAWYARRRLSETAAAWSVFALGSSLVFVAYGRLAMTDMALTLTMTAAFLTFWESLVGDKRWRLATAALLGLAALAKGPVALFFFVVIAGYTFWREKELRPAFRDLWLAGTGILFVVAGYWYLAAYKANGPLFVEKFLIEQNINRFKGGDDAHTVKEFWSYLLYFGVLFVGMLPWSIWIWKAWPRKALPEAEWNADEAFKRYLATWVAVIFLFFTVAGAKLPHYVLPVVPALALLIGIHLSQKWPEPKLRQLALPISTTILIAVLANGAFILHYSLSGQEEAHALARYVRENSIQGVPKSVATFRMGKLDKDKGTGKLELKPTTLPSLLLYLNDTVNETNDVRVVVMKKNRWLITRKGRMTDEVMREFAERGVTLQPVGPQPHHFELYELKFSEQ